VEADFPKKIVLDKGGGAFFIAEASYLLNQGKDSRELPGAYPAKMSSSARS
jgi:hypothetical protein